MYKERKDLYKNPHNKVVNWDAVKNNLEGHYHELQPLIKSFSDEDGYTEPIRLDEKSLVFNQVCTIQDLTVFFQVWNYAPRIILIAESSNPLTLESDQIKFIAELVGKIQEQTALRVSFKYEQDEKTGKTFIEYTLKPEYKDFQK